MPWSCPGDPRAATGELPPWRGLGTFRFHGEGQGLESGCPRTLAGPHGVLGRQGLRGGDGPCSPQGPGVLRTLRDEGAGPPAADGELAG